jgi:hypothetical protein
MELSGHTTGANAGQKNADVSDCPLVLRTLRSDYGFHHLDADQHDGSMLLIPNEDVWRDRLVAIDLEMHKIEGSKRSPCITSLAKDLRRMVSCVQERHGFWQGDMVSDSEN